MDEAFSSEKIQIINVFFYISSSENLYFEFSIINSCADKQKTFSTQIIEWYQWNYEENVKNI